MKTDIPRGMRRLCIGVCLVAAAANVAVAASTIAQVSDAIAGSDQYERYRNILVPATQQLVDSHKCSLAKIKTFHGWKQVGDKLMLQCSFGADASRDQWFVDTSTGQLYQSAQAAPAVAELPALKLRSDDLQAGRTNTLRVVKLPWGESLLSLLQRQQWRLAMRPSGTSPSDYFCSRNECQLDLHLVAAKEPHTTKYSCGLLFRFKFDRLAQKFEPLEWRARKMWEHKEVELGPFFADRYATDVCGP